MLLLSIEVVKAPLAPGRALRCARMWDVPRRPAGAAPLRQRSTRCAPVHSGSSASPRVLPCVSRDQTPHQSPWPFLAGFHSQ
jgi:hypothetical protein